MYGYGKVKLVKRAILFCDVAGVNVVCVCVCGGGGVSVSVFVRVSASVSDF